MTRKAEKTVPVVPAMDRLKTNVRYRGFEFNQKHRKRALLIRYEMIGGVRLAIRRCKETGQEFTDRTGRSDFINRQATVVYGQRRMQRGLAIIDTAMRWRGDRKDKTALADLCFILSLFLEEDRIAGRPSW